MTMFSRNLKDYKERISAKIAMEHGHQWILVILLKSLSYIMYCITSFLFCPSQSSSNLQFFHVLVCGNWIHISFRFWFEVNNRQEFSSQPLFTKLLSIAIDGQFVPVNFKNQCIIFAKEPLFKSPKPLIFIFAYLFLPTLTIHWTYFSVIPSTFKS